MGILYRGHCHVRPVQHLAGSQVDIVYLIDTGKKCHSAVNGQGVHHGIQPLDEQIHVQHILRQQYGEGVSRQVAGKPPLAHDGIEVGGGSLEDGIACFHVEKLIDQLEAGYVEVNEAIARFRIAGYLVSCLLQECFLRQEACQLVNVQNLLHGADFFVLGRLPQLADFVFAPSQYVLYTAADDGRIVWLGKVIGCAPFHCHYLAVHIVGRCGDDHRNVTVARI